MMPVSNVYAGLTSALSSIRRACEELEGGTDFNALPVADQAAIREQVKRIMHAVEGMHVPGC